MNESEDQARLYRQLREARGPHDRQRWILLIKELRVTHDCGIHDAERIALCDPVWQRWAERQINADPRCAKMARSHIRINGDNALIVETDGTLRVRV